MPPLLLPAPRFHECGNCGITTAFRRPMGTPDPAFEGVYFVEHMMVDRAGDRREWELCDLCEEDWQEEQNRPTLFVCRGTTFWADFPGYPSFLDTPLICVSNASAEAWKDGLHEMHETWLFCHTREEWRVAWQLARILVRNGNRPLLYPHLLRRVAAYRVPGDEDIWINGTDNIIECESPAEWGFSGLCDGCGEQSTLLTLWPGTQWANCPRCHQTAQSFCRAMRKEDHA